MRTSAVAANGRTGVQSVPSTPRLQFGTVRAQVTYQCPELDIICLEIRSYMILVLFVLGFQLRVIF